MGELVAARDVADRKDALVAGAQPRIDDDPFGRVGDARGLETQALDVRAPAGRDQQVAADDPVLATGPSRRHRDAIALALDAVDLDLLAQIDALPSSRRRTTSTAAG